MRYIKFYAPNVCATLNFIMCDLSLFACMVWCKSSKMCCLIIVTISSFILDCRLEYQSRFSFTTSLSSAIYKRRCSYRLYRGKFFIFILILGCYFSCFCCYFRYLLIICLFNWGFFSWKGIIPYKKSCNSGFFPYFVFT